ncbi:MAG: phosphate ABC transporter, permease protein PstA [Hyphomicrobium sp.]|nr:MAG: phosphate ABC transporter, permease protein PstA [Hyphomicrobium sp.]
MTDTLASPNSAPQRRQLKADAAAALLKRRYASERLFKVLGLGALLLTASFLVILLTNIVTKSIPAFSEHVVNLDVVIDPKVVDPEGKRDSATLLAADYASLTRAAIMSAIPGIEGRNPRRALTSLLSSGAADDLRERVVADPSIIGTTIKMPLLFSDDVDLYLKGSSSVTSQENGSSDLTASDVKGDITLTGAEGTFAKLVAQLESENAEVSPETGARLLTPLLPSRLIEINGGLVKLASVTPTTATGTTLIPLTSSGVAKAGSWQLDTYAQPESRRKSSDQDIAFIETLRDKGAIERNFNWRFFTSGDSREAELAGIRGALVGTAWTLLVTLIICLPIGVLAAIYLEEFAPKNKLTDIIEVNINNLAAVPSIVFGLLGLSVFLNFFGLPRSAPLVGGLVLALLVLPTIIIASRAAIKAVPPSIREAAIGLGASHQQAVFHHVLPLAMPGIMTGTIIGMAHALGETAPLLMIGMIAFIVDVPDTMTDAATVLPVQIFLWSDLPEAAFQQRTAAAIVVLLGFLFLMNGAAIWLRNKFERRW